MSEGAPRRSGTFDVSRSIWDDPDFADEPFTQREAFLWLVSEANWAVGIRRGAHGHSIKLERGEVSHSLRFLAARWQWSKSRVGRVISVFKKRDIIRDTSRDSCQVYLIKNYNKFQSAAAIERDSKWDSKWDASGTGAGQERDKREPKEPKEPKEGRGKVNGSALDPPPKSDPLPVQKAFDNYNLVAHDLGLSIAQKLTPARYRKIHLRLQEGSLEEWNRALVALGEQPFLTGENNRGWRASLDFLLQPSSYMKILEGQYAQEGDRDGGL